jgi:hypothetical protein
MVNNRLHGGLLGYRLDGKLRPTDGINWLTTEYSPCGVGSDHNRAIRSTATRIKTINVKLKATDVRGKFEEYCTA